MRNNIQEYGNLEKYIDPKVRDTFLVQLNQAVEWIYGEGQSAAKDAYRAKLDEFKKIGVPVKNRAAFYQDFPILLEQFTAFQQEVNDKFANATNLTDQGRSDIINKLTEAQQYFSNIQQAISNKQTYEDSGFKIDEVAANLEAYKYTINKMLNAPPPKQEAPPKDS